MQEHQITAFAMEFLCNIPGIEDVEDIIVSSGPNSWPNWRHFSDRIIQPGDLVIIDMAAVTWTYRVGKKPTDEQPRYYDIASEWLYKAIDKVQPGATTSISPTVHYSGEAEMTIKDFLDCGWKEALSTADREPFLQGYRFRQITFSAAAKTANDEGRQTHGRVLALLANACSMELSPASVNEPFKPFADFRPSGGGCSSTPDSFSETDLASIHTGRSDDGPALYEIYESADFVRRGLPSRDFSGATGGHA